MSKEAYALARKWNRFVLAVQKAESIWNGIQEEVMTAPTDLLENLPWEVSKKLSVFGKSKFVVALPRFIDYVRTAGGLEAMLANLNEIDKGEKEKEEDDG